MRAPTRRPEASRINSPASAPAPAGPPEPEPESLAGVFLYHYAQQAHDVLMTRRASGLADAAEIAEADEIAAFRHDPGLYVDHISFFFDPVPLDRIGQWFGGDHRIWRPGNALYQYRVDVSSLDPDILFRIVESPAIMALADAIGWTEDDGFKYQYFRECAALQKQSGEIGASRSQLETQARRFAGKTSHYFEQATQRPNFEQVRPLYAAAVPHVMLYPSSGRIACHDRARVVVGEGSAIS